MALFFALLSHIGWGVGDVFGVVATRRMGTVPMTVWRGIFAFIFATFFLLPFFWKDFFYLTPQLGALILGLSVLTLIADFAFFESLRVGNPPVVGVLSASFVAVAVLISVLFLGEHLTIEKAATVLVILSGIGLCVFDHRTVSFRWTRGELMAVIAMLGWGLYYSFIKIPVQTVGWFVPGYMFLAFFPVIGLVVRLKKQALPSPVRGGVFWVFLASVILTSLAEWSYNIAIERSDVSLVAPIAGAYPALFVALSAIVFREPMRRGQKVGIGLTLCGIVLLSLLQS